MCNENVDYTVVFKCGIANLTVRCLTDLSFFLRVADHCGVPAFTAAPAVSGRILPVYPSNKLRVGIL